MLVRAIIWLSAACLEPDLRCGSAVHYSTSLHSKARGYRHWNLYP